MIALRYLLLPCIALLSCGAPNASAAGGNAGATTQDQAIRAQMQRQPMIFFLAKGKLDACGPGCGEWIAAEGMIDPDAAKRFRDFVDGLERRNLPIFFNSIGGEVGQALALGVILREHRMTAGVGRTTPDGCRGGVASDDACRRVVQSKREHGARLVTVGAHCLSSCVYALVGASVRRVARDAQLGVHSVRMAPPAPPEGPLPSIDEAHHRLKRYMMEAGLDPALIDVAAKVSADRIHYLSRDEIARFGVEVREFYETPWLSYQDISKRFYVHKAVTQADAGSLEYRTSLLRVGCGVGAGIPVVLRRELRPNEMDVAAVVTVTVGDGALALGGRVTKGATDVRYASMRLESFRNATAGPHIVVTEAFIPPENALRWSRVIKFSTEGLSNALEQLHGQCGNAQPPLDEAAP
jgi:hypothetical protein